MSPTARAGLLAGGIVGLALLVLGIALALSAGGPAPTAARAKAAEVAPPPAVLTRSEFGRRVTAGTPVKQVLSALGPPDSTMPMEGARLWYYHGRTRDDVTGKLDTVVELRIEYEVVVRITYR